MHTDKVCFKICWNVGSHCKAQFFCRSAWLDQANLAQVSSHKGQDFWGIEATTHCCPIATANVAANFIFKWCCLPLKTSASMLKHLDWTAADVAVAKAKLSFSMWIEETFHPWYPVPSLLDSFILELKQPPTNTRTDGLYLLTGIYHIFSTFLQQHKASLPRMRIKKCWMYLIRCVAFWCLLNCFWLYLCIDWQRRGGRTGTRLHYLINVSVNTKARRQWRLRVFTGRVLRWLALSFLQGGTRGVGLREYVWGGCVNISLLREKKE